MMKFLKGLFSSRLGIVLYAINLSLTMMCVVNLRGLTAQEIDASIYGRILFVIILFTYPIHSLLYRATNFLGMPLNTNIRDLVFSMIVSLQWLLIGYIIELLISRIWKFIKR